MTNQNKSGYYVIQVTGSIEPEVVGPFPNSIAQLMAAREFRNADIDHVSFWLDIVDGVPTVGAYSGGAMEPDTLATES